MEHPTMKTITISCLLLASVFIMPWPTESALKREQVNSQNLLTRWYEQDERVAYRLTATNKDRAGTASYAATATGVVKRDDMGRFFEELAWSELVLNGTPIQIPPADQQFHPLLSLSSDRKPAVPEVARIDPRLISPTLDLAAFFADAWLVMQQPALRFPGNRSVVFNHGDTTSWADGTRVILGEDSTDVEITLGDVNLNEGTATLTMVHVAPGQPKIRIPAEWMRARVADVPNNWVQVVRGGGRRFVASIGMETFDVEMKLGLASGKIISARMNNPVEVLERECADEALTMCGDGVRYQLLRQITLVDAR
jgi:hypothetical protein